MLIGCLEWANSLLFLSLVLRGAIITILHTNYGFLFYPTGRCGMLCGRGKLLDSLMSARSTGLAVCVVLARSGCRSALGYPC
jgi:hypothetical protein